jgi:hypothetical protein
MCVTELAEEEGRRLALSSREMITRRLILVGPVVLFRIKTPAAWNVLSNHKHDTQAS